MEIHWYFHRTNTENNKVIEDKGSQGGNITIFCTTQQHAERQINTINENGLKLPVCHTSQPFQLGCLNHNSSEDGQIDPEVGMFFNKKEYSDQKIEVLLTVALKNNPDI